MSFAQYYVDSENGNDANDGLSSSAPWRTLSKVSTLAAANPGYFKSAINLARGSTFTTPLSLPLQGHPSTFLRIRAYGDASKPRPRIAITSATIYTGAIFLDSCYAWWIDEVDVDGGGLAYVGGIVSVSFTKPERAWPVRITNVSVANTGYDGITVSGSGSSLNTAFALPAGSNQQNSGAYVYNVTVDKVRNDGISFIGYVNDVLLYKTRGSNIGAGTATPIDAASGDWLTFHDGSGRVHVVDSEVDGCVDGLHAINFGSECGVLEGLRFRNCSRSCVTLEMWAETHGSVQERLEWSLRASVFSWPATATGPAAICLGRSEAAGSLITARVSNVLVENNVAGKPSILAYFAADARADECGLDVRNVAFTGAATARHIEVQRNGRTPFVTCAANRYGDEGAAKWKLDATTYATLATWTAASNSFALQLDNDADYPSSVGDLGLPGSPADDFGYARPRSSSALAGAGVNLGPDALPFFGASRLDAFGARWSAAGRWDIGAVALKGAAGMDLTTLDRVKAAVAKTDTTDDVLLADLVTNVSRRMERFTGREFYAEERTAYLSLEAGQTLLRVPGVPVSSIASLYFDPDATFGADTLLEEDDDYRVDEESGRIVLQFSPTSGGTRVVKVVYTGGVATDVPGLIDAGYGDLVQAATTQVLAEWRRNSLSSAIVDSSSNPSGSRTFTRDGWLPSVQDVLDRYRDRDL